MTDQMIGQSIDRYQLVSLLGNGQLGPVYKAIDPTLQREVAIKLVRLPEGRPDLAEALLRQAGLAARLDHPGLVKIHDFGQAGQWLFVVMDYLPGGSLAQLLQDLHAHNQWLGLGEAVGLVRQVALALDSLGRQGLAPRALKPADVFIKPDPYLGLPFRAVLTSLGLEPATVGAGGWPPNQNAPAPASAYWSPEQALGQPLDATSEVYSLGVLLYELAVGWQPFPAQSPAEARLQTQALPPPPRSRRADLPPELEAVILKALQKDRANRYADPAALAQALAEVMPQALEVDRNPANSGWIVSLLAPYQRSLDAAAATSALPIPPPAAEIRRTSVGRSFYDFDGTTVDANLVQTSPDGRVGVYVEVAQFTVTPGESTSTGIIVVNAGPELEHFSLSVSGLPAGWLALPLPPTSIPLAPGDWRRVTVTVAPPRSPASRAGRYQLLFRVARQAAPDQVVEAKLAVTVASFSQVQSEINASSVESGAPVRLLVHNQGNTPEAFAVTYDDPEAKLAFDPPAMNFSVPEGQVGAADFIVRRRGARFFGDRRVYPFGLRIAGSSGTLQQLTAEVITHALIPTWLLLVALFACCILAAGGALFANGLREGPAQTATAGALDTANAMAQQTISFVGTQLALTGTNTPTSTGTSTPTVTGTLVPPTATQTPGPATPSDTPAPPTATATFTLAAPSASPTLAPPPGGHLIFISNAGGQPNLYVVNSNGSGATPLTTTGTNQNPSWSASAQRIVFESNRDGNIQIYTMHSDGSAQTRLTNNTFADTTPVWSTDGAHIAFVSNRDGNPEIYVMNADGSAQTRLTNNAASDTMPAWAPDNAHLVFISDRDGNPELYIMDANGANQTRLTNDPEPESQPSWAPNGAWITYVRGTGAQAEIYLTTASGSGQLQLTNNSASDTDPVWAPNSSLMAFVSERDGNPEIYTMLADGSAQTRLTNSAGRDDHPIWSPAGDRLAFASDRDGVPQVYAMNANGSGQTRLTNDGATDQPGLWLP